MAKQRGDLQRDLSQGREKSAAIKNRGRSKCSIVHRIMTFQITDRPGEITQVFDLLFGITNKNSFLTNHAATLRKSRQ